MATTTGELQLEGLHLPKEPAGLKGWILTVDHKRIAKLYLFTSMLFFALGGIAALIMRTQLAVPDAEVVDGQTYNELFTMHGTIMIFLGVMPLNAAFFNYLIPLQIGARDVAYPRLNALSYWLFLSGGLMLIGLGMFVAAPDAGWFNYPPLSEAKYSPHLGVVVWLVSLGTLGVASLAAAVNFVVTILNMRAPGMSFARLPLFTWMSLITQFLLLFSMPPLTVAFILLLFDRVAGTSFFQPSEIGGDPVLWQHMFWFFGHPEVYILILPPMGMISDIIPTFARKPIFGYTAIVFSGITIGFLGFTVWVHHMFAVGLGPITNTVFAASTMLIAIPTGVKVLNWSATLWNASIRMTTPMLYAVSFVALFTVGGLSGMMHASVPVDHQHTDTYFIVAHFHYVLFGGSMMGILAAIYYWWPKMFGKMLDDSLGKVQWALTFLGFNLTFGPMHVIGNDGMPRRVYTWAGGNGWEWGNLLATAGAYLTALALALFVFILIKSMMSKDKAPGDPWDGATLEWSIPSPTPFYNFAAIPTVSSERPFWDAKYPSHRATHEPGIGEAGPPDLYDKPDEHIHMPPVSYWPLVFGVGFTLFGVGFVFMFVPAIILGTLTMLGSLYGWSLEPS